MMADTPKKKRSKGEVGRGRPPLETRFKKGQSGNPAGRPRKSRDLRKLIEDELEQSVTITESGTPIRSTKREVMVKSLVNSAVRGDEKALRIVLGLISTGQEAETTVDIDPVELARFALRHLPPSAISGSGSGAGKADGEKTDKVEPDDDEPDDGDDSP